MDRFEHYWQIALPALDGRNQRGQGWSEVLFDQTNNHYIKRQNNFLCRDSARPWRQEPTLARESRALNHLAALGFCVPTVHYYATRKNHNDYQAILVVEGLRGYQAGDTINPLNLSFQARRKLLLQVAQTIASLHKQRVQHGCLYPKHIFYNSSQVALIDLEKMKKVWHWRRAALHDLDQLARRADAHWSLKDRLYFLRAYAQNWLSLSQTHQLTRKLIKRMKRK